MDPELFRCPQTKRTLELGGGGDYLVSGDRRYQVRTWAGRQYVDFRVPVLEDPIRARQRNEYERADNRYAFTDESERARFLQKFVDARRGGNVKSKERQLLAQLRALRIAAGDLVLELGCNDGRYLDTVSVLFGARGIGIDLSELAVRNALAGGEVSSRNQFHAGDCENLPFGDNLFRCVLAFDVFEHLGHRTLARTIEECERVLAPGGSLLVYVISQRDRFTLHETIRRVSGGRFGHDDVDGHEYENFVTPDQFRALAKSAGLRMIDVQAYHGFWTLYADEFLGNRPPSLAYRWFEWLDLALTRSEHGNGFFAVAEKPS